MVNVVRKHSQLFSYKTTIGFYSYTYAVIVTSQISCNICLWYNTLQLFVYSFEVEDEIIPNFRISFYLYYVVLKICSASIFIILEEKLTVNEIVVLSVQFVLKMQEGKQHKHNGSK